MVQIYEKGEEIEEEIKEIEEEIKEIEEEEKEIYSKTALNLLLEEDEISAEEAAFMRGYLEED